jgi:hypothetical protein
VFQKLVGEKGVPGQLRSKATVPSIGIGELNVTALPVLDPADEQFTAPFASVPPVAVVEAYGLAAWPPTKK